MQIVSVHLVHDEQREDHDRHRVRQQPAAKQRRDEEDLDHAVREEIDASEHLGTSRETARALDEVAGDGVVLIAA